MVGEKFQIGKKYTKNEILAIKGSSYIPTDHCYNRYCLGGAWSNEKPGQSVLFEYIQEYEDGQNITYFKYLGPNAQYSGPVLDFRKETKGEIFGNWDNGIFTKSTKILNGIEQQIINKYLELKANNVFQEYREELERSLICIKDKYGFDFREKYNINTLTNTRGKDLLMYLFAPKDGETIGLSRILEYDTKEWGLFNGFDYQKNPVAFCSLNGSLKEWRISNGNVVQEQVAVEIAEDVKNKIIELNQYIIAKDFDKFTEKFPIKNYRFYHKFFYMLYPEYLTSYHAKSFAQNIKEKLGINLSKELGLEKYFMNIIKQSGISGIKVDDLRITVEELLLKTKTNKEDKKMKINIPLNQILYGPPGTGKTYNTIIEAMKILTFEGLFRDWYIKVYCQNNKVDSKEKTLNDYIKYLTKINEEFLKNDNIFRYHDLSKFVETKSYILNSKYITEDPTKNNKNSYYQHGLKRYEEFLEWLTYDKIKEKYAEYKNLGQIEFVTFHQSYSYEEFVEGIKPDLNSDDLKYILNKGSFRTICDSAKDLQKAKQTYKFNYSNLSLYKILMPYNDLFEYCIENDCVAIGWGEDVNIENCNSEKDLSSAIPENYEHRKQCISQLNMFKLWIDKDLKEGKDVIAIIPGSMNTIKGIAKITGNYSYNAEIENGQQQRKAEWLKKDINIPSDYIYSSKFVSPTITGMFKDKINEDNLMKLLNNASEQKSKNAVLIIDEINRGNISKIFGELITLIEEDKRDNMEVTLPYSKLPFSVPNNLYIIGTMNTSDRSIASIDIALRRRFKFKEMMPNSSLVADFGIGFNTIFDDLNNKIKLLLDRDHQIGHSYFINTKYNNNNGNNNIETLKDIWFSEILPLLNEYFYCDWEKLKLIIPGFIKKLDVPEVLKNECDDSIYEFKTFDEVADFEKALNQEKFEQV